MKNIDGKNYYSIGEVAEKVGKSKLTIRLWDEHSKREQEEGRNRYIPEPMRFGELGVRHWSEHDIEAIRQFSEQVKFRTFKQYNNRAYYEKKNKPKKVTP